MDTLTAIYRAEINSRQPIMVFDWNKAARLIKENISTLDSAEAGLENDWEWTGGYIYRNNKPDFDSYTYLSSNHAKPKLILIFKDNSEIAFYCFILETETEWNSDTKWPKSALDILSQDISNAA